MRPIRHEVMKQNGHRKATSQARPPVSHRDQRQTERTAHHQVCSRSPANGPKSWTPLRKLFLISLELRWPRILEHPALADLRLALNYTRGILSNGPDKQVVRNNMRLR